MSSRLYEVRVRAGDKLKMFHFRRNNHNQAAKEGAKKGKVISVHKVNKQAMLGNIEAIQFDDISIGEYLKGEYDDLKIDELLGLRKPNNNRRSNSDNRKRKNRGDKSTAQS